MASGRSRSTPVTSPANGTSATASRAPTLTPGATYTANDGSLTLKVDQVKSVAVPPVVSELAAPQEGGALVTACVKSGDGHFTWDAWTATDPAGLQFFHYGPTGDQPKPHFPAASSDPVPPGRCVTGWVYFELVKGATIDHVTWTNGTESASWRAT